MLGQSSSAKLRRLIEQYENKLQALENRISFSSDTILSLLLLRDEIQKTVQNTEVLSSVIVQKISNCDQKLQQYQDYIVTLDDYHQWIRAIQPQNDAWWWQWQVPNKTTRWQTFIDWSINILIVVFSGFSISLIIDIVPRILSGGIDQFSALTILIPSFVALLTTGKLTPVGENLLNSFFSNSQRKKIFIFILSLFLVISLIIIHENYHQLSSYFNEQGKNYYQKNQLAQALSNYNRAIAFNPDNGEAHYHLGILYEDLQEFDQAKTEYKIAGKQGNLLIRLQAYNNLGRLYLLNKKYQDSIFPLLEAYNEFDENKINNNIDFPKVYYMTHTNLGWTNLGLNNYSQAKVLLTEAIRIYQKHLDNLDQYKRKGKAYCLLAQVSEAQNKKTEALQYWTNCITYGNRRYPEEYIWVNMAKEKIQ
ncbi:tetratricopeptide repeat protein [Cyanothece sp. BG0011]|uniref:tetratricopeptide repeat protein n=1 Tax=Cyanothece sp. BG0011 TaxID=2082950 RepID=UPI000D1F0F1F|nr:tetratricopeptide repeat protein [Cyanothece sp. BG0011]